MSDFNADEFPALNKIRTVAYGYNFFPLAKVKCDQFSTDDTKKVFHLVQKIGSHRFQVLVEPDEIPG